jgi:hypothetical protein
MPQQAPVQGTGDMSWLPDHRGQKREFVELFAPPPPEIGQPLSGSSTLTLGEKGTPTWLRWTLLLLPIAVTAVPAYYIFTIFDNTFVALFCLVVGLGLGLDSFRKRQFWHVCEYIGRDGLAQYELSGSRSSTPSKVVMRWTDVVAIHTNEVHHLRNNSYTHTDFAYGWADANGKVKLGIVDTYVRGRISPTSRYHFALAAERAWNQFFLPHLQAQLQREGSVPFKLASQNDQRIIRVGYGYIDFINFDAQPVRVTRQEIASFSLAGGEFQFKHVDARWYSSAGKYKFRYTSMPNAQLFLMFLENLMGMKP